MRKLDQVLASSASRALPKDLKREYEFKLEDLGKAGKIMGERQVVKMFIECLKLQSSEAFISTYESLKAMPWYGDTDGQITSFYYDWIRMVENLQVKLSPDAIRNLLHEKMRQSGRYANDLCVYQRGKDK